MPGSLDQFCLELVTYGSHSATIIEMELAEIELIDSCKMGVRCDFNNDTCDMTLRTHESRV